MASDDIRRRLDRITSEHGAWTAHGIRLAADVHTLEPPQEDTRIRRVLQVGADLAGKPLDQLRVLDLGSLEGQFAIEFALHGAEVLAIEGRAANIAKAEFAKQVLRLEKLEFRQDDVRNLSLDRYGSFDIILCLGILYHLNEPDAMELVSRIFECCSRAAIIDTHVSLRPETCVSWRGKPYWGASWTEYPAGSSDSEIEGKYLWSSMGNDRSFHFTVPSLCNLLKHVGFTSVYECLNPYEYHNPAWPLAPTSDERVVHAGRLTLVAVKGVRQAVVSAPATQAAAERDRPETPQFMREIHSPGLSGATTGLLRRTARKARRLIRRAAGARRP